MTVLPFFQQPKRLVRKVFLHCSDSDRPEHDDVAVIRQWHLARGFRDVGYHYFLKKNGAIQTGRSVDLVPAAQQGNNTGTIAICLHGREEKRFTQEQFEALKNLCVSILLVLPDVTFHGHCEVNKGKACPVFQYRKVLNLTEKGRMIHD